MAVQVSDSASNRPEQIENAAKAIGTSLSRRLVFEAIHHHKSKVKTVGDIAERTGLSRKQVLNAAKVLVKKRIVEQTKDGDTAYEKNDFLQAHKSEVLSLAGNPKKLASYRTKRNVSAAVVVSVSVPVSTALVDQITIDDIDNFRKVRGKTSGEHLPAFLPETSFKRGIQRLLGEPGNFKDWGGEKNDLLSTRLKLGGKRRTVAFAFKGPGLKGKLTPGKMGKNGDQIQRLIQSAADVFIVQHWREIEESVLEQLRGLATAKSATSGRRVWFGIVDGYDSRRIYDAYPEAFTAPRSRR